jgi:hypothetical protein
MRRLSGLLVTGALLLLPAFIQGPSWVSERFSAQAQALTFDGDMALWIVAIKPGQTAQFEDLMGKLKAALMASETSGRKAQAAGWKVVKSETPAPDGNITYVHVISPVVRDADYTILTILYESTTDPTEQRALYDQYREALASTLGQAPYTQVMDLSK